MEIRKFVSQILESNMYILVEKARMIVIDPCVSSSSIKRCLERCREVDFVLLTHEHYDHIACLNQFKQTTNATAVGTIACAEAIKSPTKNLAGYFSMLKELMPHHNKIDMKSIDAQFRSELDLAFENTLEINWEGHLIKIVSTPGHSPGSCCIIVDEDKLFCGDTLIFDSAPITRLPYGSLKQWEMSARPFFNSLPDGTRVFPGHLQEFKLGEHHMFTSQDLEISTDPIGELRNNGY